MTQGKFSPGFSISHDAGEAFPEAEEISRFGYTPFDLFLKEEVSEPVLDPRLTIRGESAAGLLENLERDLLLVFRYSKDDFDLQSDEFPEGPDELPAFQWEVYPARLRPDGDFRAVTEMLENSVEEVTDSFYAYGMDMRRSGRNGDVKRCTGFGEYLHEISGREIDVMPEIYGISQVSISPETMAAEMWLYQQEVVVKRRDYASRDDRRTENRWEEVFLNYDESQVDELVQRLEREGFSVDKEYHSRNVAPPEVQDFE